MQKVAKRHIHRYVKDPALRKALTPDYVMGCKRVLISDDYYPALANEKTSVIRAGIDHVSENAIHDSDGGVHEVDAIIFSTGFRVANVEDQPEMVGRGGKTLTQAWSKGAEAYLGLSVPGFPNYFIMTGPNTGLGHNSVVFMVETMVHYIMDALKKMEREGIQALDIRQDVHDAFNKDIQQHLHRTVWESGCKSWYQTDDGRNTTLWPGFTVTYWLKTRSLKRRNYDAV
jgi:cation diffusion facilitator CzcD-associated flavoprotein CzcO